jgi:hypothetical protein
MTDSIYTSNSADGSSDKDIDPNINFFCRVSLGKHFLFNADSMAITGIEDHAIIQSSPAIHHNYICTYGIKIKNNKTMPNYARS